MVIVGGICMGLWVLFFLWRFLSKAKKGEK